ncbi:MAG TPA: DNA-primase RepB domain-containing protein [Candidatus Angelobacter sp.]
MLKTFASVGATRFDLTHTNIEGEKRGFRPQQSMHQLSNSLPKLFPGTTARRNNIIVRPCGDHVHFIQLDDLDEAAVSRVGEAAFLTIETSPGNHQAWIAMSSLPQGEHAKDFVRRVRKAAGADPSASGATRVAGTTNYKRKYEPDFPEVTIIATAPDRIMTAAQLEALGLVAPAEPDKASPVIPLRPHRREHTGSRERQWPDYERCVAGAPASKEGDGPDRSMADFFWCMLAAQRGWTIEEIASKLLEVSEKAQERVRLRDEGYALVTAQNGADAARRRQQGRGE